MKNDRQLSSSKFYVSHLLHTIRAAELYKTLLVNTPFCCVAKIKLLVFKKPIVFPTKLKREAGDRLKKSIFSIFSNSTD